jgi:aspartate aminotransferase
MSGQLSPELETLLTLQERFDQRFELWRLRAGVYTCDFAYANPYDGPDRTVMGAIEDALHTLRILQLQYTPYGGNAVTRRLIAERLSETHDSPFGWRDIVLTPGAMAALNVVFRAVRTTAVDEVVVLIPCWMDYPLYLTQLGIKPVLVSLTRDAFHFDLACIERAITPATRAIIFSQPANPTGVLYCDEELARLAELLREKATGSSQPPILIADECHRQVVYLPDKFVSPLQHYDATVIVYSFGKSLLIQGQRIGYAAVSPRMPSRESLPHDGLLHADGADATGYS